MCLFCGLNSPLSDLNDRGLKDSRLFDESDNWKFDDLFWLISWPLVIGGNSGLASPDMDELGCERGLALLWFDLAFLFLSFLFDPKFWKKFEMVCSLPPCLTFSWKIIKYISYMINKMPSAKLLVYFSIKYNSSKNHLYCCRTINKRILKSVSLDFGQDKCWK